MNGCLCDAVERSRCVLRTRAGWLMDGAVVLALCDDCICAVARSLPTTIVGALEIEAPERNAAARGRCPSPAFPDCLMLPREDIAPGVVVLVPDDPDLDWLWLGAFAPDGTWWTYGYAASPAEREREFQSCRDFLSGLGRRHDVGRVR